MHLVLKKITLLSVFIVLYSANTYAVSPECHMFLSANTFHVSSALLNPHLNSTDKNLEGEELFLAFQKAYAATLVMDEEEITTEDLKKFKVPSRLMTALKRVSHNRENAFDFIVWTTLERKIFNSPEKENQDFIRKVEPVYHAYTDEFKKIPIGYLYATIVKGKLGSAEAKKKVARQLKRYSYLFTLTYGEPINLLEESGWLKVFDIEDLSQLNARIDENYFKNRNLYNRIKQILKETQSPGTFFHSLTEEFFGYRELDFKNDAHGFLVRNITPEVIKELIVELRLGDRLQKKYFDLVDFMMTFETNANYRIPLGLTLIFFKAYMEVNEDVVGFTNISVSERVFSPQLFLGLKRTLMHKKILNAIEDERYSSYIDRSEALNSKHKDLEFKILDLKNRYPKYIVEISKLETALGRIPEINDFDDDLDSIEKRLGALEVQRDELTEKILETVTKESIVHFEDLNFRWERLIPDKSYEVKGLDYNSVVFSKNVVERFQQQTLTGARFLAAFSKSYVGMKKSTGLRKLPALHIDFRDIKVIRTGNKIRIVGRLVGKTIYFYHIYEEDRPYDNKFMFHLIDNFKPHK